MAMRTAVLERLSIRGPTTAFAGAALCTRFEHHKRRTSVCNTQPQELRRTRVRASVVRVLLLLGLLPVPRRAAPLRRTRACAKKTKCKNGRKPKTKTEKSVSVRCEGHSAAGEAKRSDTLV